MIQNKFEKEEEQYYQLIKDILHNGTLEQGRNGNTISIFGSSMHFSLQDNKIPLLTSKQLAWKTCLKELLWFISGSTDNSILQEQNVHIWDGDAKKASEFNYIDGDLGPIYGHQWRHFNADYIDCKTDYTNKSFIAYKTSEKENAFVFIVVPGFRPEHIPTYKIIQTDKKEMLIPLNELTHFFSEESLYNYITIEDYLEHFIKPKKTTYVKKKPTRLIIIEEENEQPKKEVKKKLKKVLQKYKKQKLIIEHDLPESILEE